MQKVFSRSTNPSDWGIAHEAKKQSKVGFILAIIVVATLFFFFNDGIVVGFGN